MIRGRGRATRSNPEGLTPQGRNNAPPRGGLTNRGRGRPPIRRMTIPSRGRGGRQGEHINDNDHAGAVNEPQNHDEEVESQPTPQQQQQQQQGVEIPPLDEIGKVLDWYKRARGQQEGNVQVIGSQMGEQEVNMMSKRNREETKPLIRISKYLREARELGCKSFTGVGDISVAADWISKLKETAEDMELTEPLKLTVATKLLEGIAATWWTSIKGKYQGKVTWAKFEKEFYEQFYSAYEVNLKHQEYTELKQGELSVKELEQKFRDFARFLPEYASNENRMASKFWYALSLDVRDRGNFHEEMTFSQVVNQGLRGEKSLMERRQQDQEDNKKRRVEGGGLLNPPKRSNSNGTYGGSRGPSLPSQGRQTTSIADSRSKPLWNDKCRNCGKRHSGKCREPPRCYNCGDTSHMMNSCPKQRRTNLEQNTIRPTRGDTRSGMSQISPNQRGGPTSNAPSVNQGRTQARVYAMTEEDARENPESVTGIVVIDGMDARILIDTGAQRSFVSETFATKLSRPKGLLPQTLVVSTPLGEEIEKKEFYPSCIIQIQDCRLECDLIPLGMLEFDAIIGMDWLSKYHAKV
ncbi:unnamed protein product, partial [Cuscuta epithymum]